MTYRARKTPLKRRHSETTCDKGDNDTSSKFKETNASRLFKWPGKMIQKIFSEKPNGKPIHVQLWTEFSGAGTAEVALNGISSACHLLTSQVMGSADWAPHSRMALINNSTDASQHVFGDIADVCPSSMLEKAKRNVALTVPQQHHYVTMFECTYFSNFIPLSFLQIKDLIFPTFLKPRFACLSKTFSEHWAMQTLCTGSLENLIRRGPRNCPTAKGIQLMICLRKQRRKLTLG